MQLRRRDIRVLRMVGRVVEARRSWSWGWWVCEEGPLGWIFSLLGRGPVLGGLAGGTVGGGCGGDGRLALSVTVRGEWG